MGKKKEIKLILPCKSLKELNICAQAETSKADVHSFSITDLRLTANVLQ